MHNCPFKVGDILRCTNMDYSSGGAIVQVKAVTSMLIYNILEESEHSKKHDRPTGSEGQVFIENGTLENFEYVDNTPEPVYETEVTPASFNDLFGG